MWTLFRKETDKKKEPISKNKVILRRIETSDHGTFGILSFPGFSCFSGELPDRGNKPNTSCIPKGTYKAVWSHSPRFKRNMYLVLNVAQRAGIRIHAANFMGDDSKGFKRQLNGCVALGERLGSIEGQKALLLSKPAIRRFETLMNGRDFELEII